MRENIERYPIIVWSDAIDFQVRGTSDTEATIEYTLFREGTDGAQIAERGFRTVPIELLGAFISKDRVLINQILAQQTPAKEFMPGITIPAMKLAELPAAPPPADPVIPG